ncbi:MAG: site-specific DNA-methyltransferase [Bacilli bacterium]|nr:site-specific DNA-methyltransferase [Bacilli bacterium]
MKKFDKNQKIPTFIEGDSFAILKTLNDKSIDCVITSPPYFREREKNKHFNLNQTLDSYIENILLISREIKRVLKDEGSFWLNLGDSYQKTSLQLIPTKIASKLIEDGWILNNDVIWKKTSYTPTSYKKRLSSSFEHFFHFVKTNEFYYNLIALDAKKRRPNISDGVIKTSSNVTGVNYLKILSDSSILSPIQKGNAIKTLKECLDEVKDGKISDFRFLIKGHNKVNSGNRKEELENNGFIVIKSKYNKPSDVWEILPEKNSIHYAPFPESLVSFPIIVTCPPKGIVLDPFVGSGTTCYVAMKNNRNSIGIDINKDFIKYAKRRCFKED